MVRYAFIVTAVFLFVCSSERVHAQIVYALNASLGGGGGSASANFNTQAGLFASTSQNGIAAILPGYNGTQDVTLVFNSNGVVGTIDVTTGPVHQARLSFASNPGASEVFFDDDRDALIARVAAIAADEIGAQPDVVVVDPNQDGNKPKDDGKSGGNSTTNPTTPTPAPLRGRAALAAGTVGPNTPIDMVAGNPGSLMSRMVANDFEIGTRVGFGIDIITLGAGGARPSSPWSLTGTFGFWSAAGVEISLMELPFGYYKPLDDPRYAFVLEAPISLIGLDGKQAISASIGAGVRLPVTNDWMVTPIVRVGAATSEDLGLEGFLWSASVVSDYQTSFNGLDFGIGNQITHVRTIPIGANDYDLQNTVFRNGIGLAGPTDFNMFGEKATWEATLVNTQYFGDEIYVENQTDLGISLGTRGTDNGVKWDSARIGLTISLTDQEYSGFSFNFGYKF